jgi:hypothetical protein
MYKSSLRHLVWVPETNVKACNSVAGYVLDKEEGEHDCSRVQKTKANI